MLITDDRTKYKEMKRDEFDKKFPSEKHNSNVYNIGDTAEYNGIYRCIATQCNGLSCHFEITMKKGEKFPPHTFEDHNVEWSLIATHDGETVYVVVDEILDRCFNSSYKPTIQNPKFASGIYSFRTVLFTPHSASKPITTKLFTRDDKSAPFCGSLIVVADTEKNREILSIEE